jgi:hypothetical protein
MPSCSTLSSLVRSPAVSIILSGMPLMCIVSFNTSRVVPAISVTIALEDKVEQEGIKRAHGEIERADVVLLVFDAQDEAPDLSILPSGIECHNRTRFLRQCIE